MKKYKLRSYISKNPKRALRDLDEFYKKAKDEILFEASTIADEVEIRNVNFTIDKENREITKLHRFFRGAVLPYYIRQQVNNYDPELKIVKSVQDKYLNEIKTQVGFFVYDYAGKPTKLNSFEVFEETKRFVDTLADIENICFLDQGYKFPDSKHYHELEKEYGHINAPNVAMAELKQWHKNQFPVIPT